MKKLLIAIAAFSLAAPAAAQSVNVASAFSKGRTHFAVTAGNGYAFDQNYFVLGVGVSYYVIDGLNVGLNYEWWTGSDPEMTKITPSVQYVFHQMQRLKPYVGGFYRRTNIDGLPDLDSVGARAGAYFQAGRNMFLGVGGVYESYLDCSSTVYRKCDSTYVEVGVTFAF
jgi:opacity protein-like surface antigen